MAGNTLSSCWRERENSRGLLPGAYLMSECVVWIIFPDYLNSAWITHILKIWSKSEPCLLLFYSWWDRNGRVWRTREIPVSERFLWVCIQLGWKVSALSPYSEFLVCPQDTGHEQVKEKQLKLHSGYRGLYPAWGSVLSLDSR